MKQSPITDVSHATWERLFCLLDKRALFNYYSLFNYNLQQNAQSYTYVFFMRIVLFCLLFFLEGMPDLCGMLPVV